MTDARRRGGSETRQRQLWAKARVTPSEHAAIAEAANKAGLKVGSYVRLKLLDGSAPRSVKVPPIERRLLAQTLGQLGKVGSNINQLAHSSNIGNSPDRLELQRALLDLTRLRDAIMISLGKRVP